MGDRAVATIAITTAPTQTIATKTTSAQTITTTTAHIHNHSDTSDYNATPDVKIRTGTVWYFENAQFRIHIAPNS